MTTGLFLPTPAQIQQTLTVLEPAQRHKLLRVILKVEGDGRLTLPDVLAVYLYEWLAHLGFLDEAQMRFLLGKAYSDLRFQNEEYRAWYQPGLSKRGRPSWGLTIADRRYATWGL